MAEELNTYEGAQEQAPQEVANQTDVGRPSDQIIDPLTLNQGPTQVGETHTKNIGRITPSISPVGFVDLDVDDVFIPAPMREGPLDPTVIENATNLANILKVNPVQMDFPGTIDVNSPIYKPIQSSEKQLTSLEKGIQEFGQEVSLPDPVTPSQPLRFGIKATNYDRYDAPGFENLFNQIGFHPYIDNESIYNANSSWWDENARMRSQFSRIFSTGFMSTYEAIGDLMRGDYLDPNSSGSDIFEDAMRIGNSSKDGIGSFANNFLLNSGYTFGILANIAVEELALAGLEAVTIGGATPIVASRTAYNLVRGGKAIKNLGNIKKTAATSKSLLQRMKEFSFTRDFWNAGGRFMGNALTPNTIKAIKGIHTTNNTARQLSGIAKASKTVGGLYRDVRAINLAMSESKLEAGMTERHTFDELYNGHLADYGVAPEGEALANMRQKGAEAGFTTLMWNFPIIFFSNALVFDTALRGFRGVVGKSMTDLTTDVGRRVVKKSPSQLKKARAAATKAGKPVDAYIDLGKSVSGFGIRRTLKRGIRGNLNLLKWGGLRYFSTGYVEGLQEVAQEAIAVGSQDYYTNLYKDPASGGYDAQMASIWSGIDSQMSGQGFEVFMSGFLMGGLVQGPQKLVFNTLPELYQKKFDADNYKKYNDQRENYIKEVVNAANEVYNDPEYYFDENKLNALQQKASNEGLFDSQQIGSALDHYDEKDAAIFSHLYLLAKSNKLYDFKQDIKDYLKLDDKALQESFPNATEKEISSGKTRERLTKMSERLDKIEEAYKKLNDAIINPFDPSIYKEGTQEHISEKINQAAFEHAKMLAIFANDSFQRSLERVNSIYSDVSKISSAFATNDIDNLLDLKKLIQEIDLLKVEIDLSTKPVVVLNENDEAVEQQRELTDDEKIEIDKKREKLVLLQSIFRVLTTPAFNDRGPFVSAVAQDEEDDKKVNKEKEQEIYQKSIEEMRQRILSDDVLKTDGDLIKILAESVSDPFGQYKIENAQELIDVIQPYVEFLIQGVDGQSSAELPNDIKDLVQKIIDYKALKGRSEDIDLAVNTVLQPEALANLAEKIAPRFKRLYFENKRNIDERVRKYVGIVERNTFLSTLSKAGIFPREDEVKKFLEDGTLPTVYGNYNGVIDETSGRPYVILQDAINVYTNTRSDKPKEKTQENTDPEDVEADSDFNYEDTFEDVDPDVTEDVTAEQVNVEEQPIEDKKIAKDYLKDQWRKYVKLRSSKNKNYLDYTPWLKSQNSKTVRKRAVAINDIVQNIYNPALLSDPNTKPFYEWLSENRNNQKVRDVLKLYNLTLSQISQATVPTTFDSSLEKKGKTKTTPHTSGINVQRKQIRTKDGETVNQYILVDNNNESVSDNVYSTAREATLARDAKVKAETPEETYTVGRQDISKGEIVQDAKGNWWIVQSSKDDVEKNNNIELHKYNVKNPRKKDKKRIKTSTFQKGYNVISNEDIDFINTVSKLPVKEPLSIFPEKDNQIKNREERIQKANEGQQDILRELGPEKIKDINVEIIKNELQGDIDIKRRRNLRFGNKESNPKIKIGQQKYSIKLSITDTTTGEEKVIGYFQGPETALFVNQAGPKGKQISPFDINETNVREYFIVYPNQNVEDIVKQIHENYTASYYIYDQIDQLFKNNLESTINVKLSELDFLSAVLTPGQQALLPNNEKIPFNTLDTQFVSDDTSDTTDGNKPYYILDFQRDYERRGDGRIKALPITNIKSRSDLRRRIREKVKDFEKSDIKNKLGRYFAYVELKNGKGSFIDLTPAEMSDKDFTKILDTMKEVSQDTFDNNTEVDNQGRRVAKKLNYKQNDNLSSKLKEELFIATDKPGEYITLSYSPASGMAVEYINLNAKKGSNKRKGRGFISNENLQKVRDQFDLAKEINSVVKKASGIDIKADSFKYSVNKEGESIDIIGLMLTRHNTQIKENFSLLLKVDPSEISLEKYQANLISGLSVEETAEESEPAQETELSARKKREIVKSDYTDVPREQLKAIARKLTEQKVLSEFEQSILEANSDLIDGFKLEILQENDISIITEAGAANQTALEALMIAEEALDNFSKDYRKSRRKELPDNLSVAEKNRQINKELKDIKTNPANPLYLEYQKLVNVRNNAEDESNAFKITDKFDGNDIEDIDTFGRWLQENVNTDFVKLNPDLVVDTMVNNKTVVGKVIMSMQRIGENVPGLVTTVHVGTDTPFKYHEAFHAVFRTFLTDAEISKYLKLAAKEVKSKLRSEGKTLDQALEEMRKEHPMYAAMDKATLTDRLYEEYMADEFDKFKMNPQSTNVDADTKSLFQRIIDLILSVLARFSGDTLNALYKNIDSGKYKNANVQQNRFTEPFLNEFDTAPSVALKVSIKLGTKVVKKYNADKTSYINKRVNNYMPADHQHIIISGITNLFIKREMDQKTVPNSNEILEKSIFDFIELYNPDRDFYVSQEEWYDDNVSRIEDYYNALLAQTDDIKEAVLDRLADFDYQLDSKIDEREQAEADFGDVTSEQWDRQINEIGGYGSAPRLVRKLIAGTSIAEQDMFGNRFVDENQKEPVLISVDYNMVYESLLKVAAGENNTRRMLEKMWVYSDGNPQTKAVVDEMFKQMGILEFARSGDLFDPTVPMPTIESKTGKEQSLFQMFTNTFKNFRQDYMIVHRDSGTGIVHLYSATKSDDAHHSLIQMADSFNDKYSKLRIEGSEEKDAAIDAIESAAEFLSYNKVPSNINLTDEAKSISTDLYETTGIKMSANYLLYSLYQRLIDQDVAITDKQRLLFDAFDYADPLTFDDISEIKKSIERNENIFLDNQFDERDKSNVEEFQTEQEEDAAIEGEAYEGGAQGKLRKIALNNAYFDESIGSSTFFDAENNRIYSHQQGTFHLEKIAEMSDPDFIELKKGESAYMSDNYLINDPAFQSMVMNGQVKSMRIGGYKDGPLAISPLGKIKASRSYDRNGKGTKFGSLTPQQFILSVIDAYLYNYNRVSPDKTKLGEYEGQDGPVKFAMSPNFIRVIEASDTGDFVSLPVRKMIEDTGDGLSITKEGIDGFKKVIEQEFNRIRQASVEGNVDNEQNFERKLTFTNTKDLLKIIKKRNRLRVSYRDPQLGKDVKEAIINGDQKVMLSQSTAAAFTNLSEKQSGRIMFEEIDPNVDITMTNAGQINAKDLSDDQLTELIKDFGSYIGKTKEGKRIFSFRVGETEYFTYSPTVSAFFNSRNYENGKTLNLFNFSVSAEQAELVLDDDGSVVPADVDASVVDILTTFAKDPEKTFEQAWSESGAQEIMTTRLINEATEFIELLKDFKAYSKISDEIRTGLGKVVTNDKGTISYDRSADTQAMAELYNLKDDALDFNITQIFLNNYLNTKAFNDTILGDQATTLGDAIAQIKRAKMQNAAGKSAAHDIIAPKLGINHTLEEITQVTYEDSEYKKLFSKVLAEQKPDLKPGERGDGQMLITLKALRHFMFGFGTLTPQQSRILDLIDDGNLETLETEFFGTKDFASYKKLDGIINSQKLVYGDGKTYLKMSAFILTKNFTSERDESGNFVPIDGREGLHYLREKLEKYESENNTVGIAVPESASKMYKSNVITSTEAFSFGTLDDTNTSRLDANFMRLQVVNPSNKTMIIDARQMLNLITAEQDVTDKITIDGVELSAGDVIDLYHQARNDKQANAFFAKRNLVFDFKGILNDFVNTKQGKEATPRLTAFLEFAQQGLRASQAKTQMLSYFSMEESGTGDPDFNLNNQLTEKKFQELFLSFMSKGTISSRQPGIAAALVSDDQFKVVKQVISVDEVGTPTEWRVIRQKDWSKIKNDNTLIKKYADPVNEIHKGLSKDQFYLDRLRTAKDKDGNEYMEMVIPPHFKSIVDNIGEIDMYEELPDAISKYFGIRIPSQDKHSAANLKVVDFLPVYYGSSAIFARELVELSGADFDIDKLYMQIKDFYYENGQFLEYGSATTEIGKYEEYVRFIKREVSNKGSIIRSAVDAWVAQGKTEEFPITIVDAEEYNNFTIEERNELTQGNFKIFAEILSLDPALDIEGDLFFKTIYGVPEGLALLGMPVSFQEYTEFKEKNGREPYNAPIDNKLLDLKYGLLGHPGMSEGKSGRELGIAKEPANLVPLKDELNNLGALEFILEELPELAEFINEQDVDIDNLRGQLEAYEANKEGARSIGTVVLPNVVVNILKEFNVKVRSRNIDGVEQIKRFTYDGVEYTEFVDYVIEDGVEVKDRFRTQYIISALVTAMTDNAKERLAAKLGLKKQTLGMVTQMTAMGLNIKDTVLMLQHPSIKKALFEAVNKDDIFDPGFKTIIESRINSIENRFNENDQDIDSEQYQIKFNRENLVDSVRKTELDPELSSEEINPDVSLEDLAFEHKFLSQFLIALDQADFLYNMSVLLSLQTGFGRDLYDFMEIAEAADKLGLYMTDKEFSESTLPFDLRPIFKGNNSFHAFYFNAFEELRTQLLPKLFIQLTSPFAEIRSMLGSGMNLRGKEEHQKASTNLIGVLNTMAYMQALRNDSQYNGTELASLNNSFIYPDKIYGKPQTAQSKGAGVGPSLNIIDVVTRLRENSKYNYFVDEFISLRDVQNEHNFEGLDLIITNNFTRLSDATLTNIQNDILNLYSDPKTHKDTIHLVNYLLVKDGFSYAKNSFLSVVPVDLTRNILNSIDKVQKLFLTENAGDEAYKRVFGMNYRDLKEYIVTEYLQRTSNKYFTKKKSAENIPVSFVKQYEDPAFEEGRIIIDSDVADSESSSNMLSRYGARSFEYGGKTFFSIDHAYQVMLSGSFDSTLDKKWRAGKDDPKDSIPGKKGTGKLKSRRKAKNKNALLTQLTRLSILQSANMEDETGVPLGQLVVTNTQFDFIGETKEEQDAIRRGILQARQELKLEVAKDEFGVDTFKYISTDRISKREKASKEALKEPIVNNLETKELIIDRYKGLPVFYVDRVKRIRRKKAAAKGDFTQSAKLKVIDSKLKKAGFSVRKKEIIINGKPVLVDQIEAPLVFLMPNQKGELEVYKLRLDEVERDGYYKGADNIDDVIAKGQSSVFGNKFVYDNLGSTKGSRAQNVLAFLFGESPTEKQINEFNINKFALDIEDVSDDIEVDPEDPTIEDLEEGADALSLFEEAADAIPEDLLEDGNTLSDQLEVTKEELVEAFYDSLTEEQKEKIGTKDEIMEAYLSFPNEAEAFIENIKKCHLK